MLFIILLLSDLNKSLQAENDYHLLAETRLKHWNLKRSRFSGHSTVKTPPVMQEMWVRSLSQEHPWRKKWQPTPVFLLGKYHGQRNLAGYSHGIAKHRTQLSNWTHTHTHTPLNTSVPFWRKNKGRSVSNSENTFSPLLHNVNCLWTKTKTSLSTHTHTHTHTHTPFVFSLAAYSTVPIHK